MAEPNAQTTHTNTGHNDEKKMAKKPLRDDPHSHEMDANGRKRRRRRRCCLSCAAIVVVIVVTIVILSRTAFKVRNPKIAVTSVSVEGVEASVENMKVHLNLTIMAGVAMKNPNKIASFKHGNSTTIILYRGDTVGQAVMPAGKIKADKTVNMNVAVTVYVDELVDNGLSLLIDGIAGNVALTTRTEIAGRVKFMGMIKKHISVRAECSFNVDLKSRTTQMQKCDKSFKL